LKRSIKQLEAITPRTSKIEAALIEYRGWDEKLRRCAKDPVLIRNLVNNSLEDFVVTAEGFRQSQKEKRQKRRVYKGLTKEQRDERNKKMRIAWAKSKLSKNSFAQRQAKKHNIGITQIKHIIKDCK
jgi:hypothetical protein